MKKTFTEKELKDLVLEFRRKNKEYLKQMIFCTEHKFEFEAQIFKMKADLMNDVAFEIENNRQIFEKQFRFNKTSKTIAINEKRI